MFEYIRENLERVRERIYAAALKSGRDPKSITLVAVSKTFPADIIHAAVNYGVSDIGESRLQEAEPKIRELGGITKWHMIGHLQTNKIKRAVPLFDMIQSIDSIRLAEGIESETEAIGKKVDCLLEVNSSGEESKFGVEPDETMAMIEKFMEFKYISLRGLMTIGPYTDDTDAIRNAFGMVNRLFIDGQKIAGDNFSILSMGMSSDFEVAIEEGSNMVRVGTAIFGTR